MAGKYILVVSIKRRIKNNFPLKTKILLTKLNPNANNSLSLQSNVVSLSTNRMIFILFNKIK